MKLKWMKSILHTIIKELRFMESNLNIVEHLLQKEVTAIQRFAHTIARTLNYGKPSFIDLLRFGKCLESKSFVMLDGSNSYNELLESKNCTKKVLISHESYDKFNHLNTVNSFHK